MGCPDALDQRVDIYSFGVVVFRALSGHLPFEAESLQEKFLLTTTAPRPSLVALRPDLPADVDAWVQEVLAIDPNGRFTTIRAAYTALVAALDTVAPLGELPHAPPPPPPDPFERAPEPERGGALAGAWRAVTAAVRRFASREPQKPAAPPRGVAQGGEKSLVSTLLAGSDLDLPRPPPLAAPPAPLASAPQSGAAVAVARTVSVEGLSGEPAPLEGAAPYRAKPRRSAELTDPARAGSARGKAGKKEPRKRASAERTEPMGKERRRARASERAEPPARKPEPTKRRSRGETERTQPMADADKPKKRSRRP